jgi:hypothetical protein
MTGIQYGVIVSAATVAPHSYPYPQSRVVTPPIETQLDPSSVGINATFVAIFGRRRHFSLNQTPTTESVGKCDKEPSHSLQHNMMLKTLGAC